jgi:imidazolonepropionase
MRFDRLLTNARLATMVASDQPYGILDNAAIGIKDARIAWVGPVGEAPKDAISVDDLEGRLVIRI